MVKGSNTTPAKRSILKLRSPVVQRACHQWYQCHKATCPNTTSATHATSATSATNATSDTNATKPTINQSNLVMK